MKWKKQPIKAVNFGVFRFVSFSLCIIYIFVLFMSFLNLMTFETAWSNVTEKEKKSPKLIALFSWTFTEQSNSFHSQVPTQLSVVSLWLLHLFSLYYNRLLTIAYLTSFGKEKVCVNRKLSPSTLRFGYVSKSRHVLVI